MTSFGRVTATALGVSLLAAVATGALAQQVPQNPDARRAPPVWVSHGDAQVGAPTLRPNAPVTPVPANRKIDPDVKATKQ